MTTTLFTLIIFFVSLSMVFVILIIMGRSKSTTQKIDHLLEDTLNVWLQKQVCLHCDLSMDDLDRRAINRISGAALKAVKPLRESHQVQIHLPQIGRHLGGPWKDFTVEVHIDEIQPLIDTRNI